MCKSRSLKVIYFYKSQQSKNNNHLDIFGFHLTTEAVTTVNDISMKEYQTYLHPVV